MFWHVWCGDLNRIEWYKFTKQMLLETKRTPHKWLISYPYICILISRNDRPEIPHWRQLEISLLRMFALKHWFFSHVNYIHSRAYLPVQPVPSMALILKPSLQMHWKEPGMFWQVPAHGEFWHSSMSEKDSSIHFNISTFMFYPLWTQVLLTRCSVQGPILLCNYAD